MTNLGLESEESKTKEHSEGDKQSLEDDDVVIKCHHYTEREGLHESEGGQKDKVPWVGVPLPVQETEIDQGSEERDVEGPDAEWGELN
jgi:hypothetical protein